MNASRRLSADTQACRAYRSYRLCISLLVSSLVQGAIGVRYKLFSIFKRRIPICKSKKSVLWRKTRFKLEDRCVWLCIFKLASTKKAILCPFCKFVLPAAAHLLIVLDHLSKEIQAFFLTPFYFVNNFYKEVGFLYSLHKYLPSPPPPPKYPPSRHTCVPNCMALGPFFPPAV